MTIRYPFILATLTLSLAPAHAFAQSGFGTFALGGKVSFKGSTERMSSGATNIGILWRLGHGGEGWGPKYGLNWYSAHLDTTIGDRRQAFGELKLRPLMLGYGYSRSFGRVHASANILGGLAITSFSLSSSANDAFRRQLAASSVDADASNPLVLRPEISVWIDASRKIGINVNAGYMFAQPRVVVSGAGGRAVRRVDASMFTLSVGAAYSIF